MAELHIQYGEDMGRLLRDDNSTDGYSHSEGGKGDEIGFSSQADLAVPRSDDERSMSDRGSGRDLIEQFQIGHLKSAETSALTDPESNDDAKTHTCKPEETNNHGHKIQYVFAINTIPFYR